jgi:hypothetical protein
MRWEVIDLKPGDWVRLLKPAYYGRYEYRPGTIGQLYVRTPTAKVKVDPPLGTANQYFTHVYVDTNLEDLEPAQQPKITTLHIDAARWETYVDTPIILSSDRNVYHFDFDHGTYWVENSPNEGICTQDHPSQFRRAESGQDVGDALNASTGKWQFHHVHMGEGNWNGFSERDSAVLERAFKRYNKGVTSALWEVKDTDIQIKFPGDTDTFHFDFDNGTYWVENNRGPLCTQSNPSKVRRVAPGKWQFKHEVDDDWEDFPVSKIEAMELAFKQYNRGITSSLWEVSNTMDVKLPPNNDLYHFDLDAGEYWVEGKEDGVAAEGKHSFFRRRGPMYWQFTHTTLAGEDDWANFEWGDEKILEQAYQAHTGTTSSLRWEVEPEEVQAGDRVKMKDNDTTRDWIMSGFYNGGAAQAQARTDSLFSSVGAVIGLDSETSFENRGRRWEVKWPVGTPADGMGAWYIPESFLEIVEHV